MESPKVFISYSHVDDVFEKRMYEFANRLRTDGIDANIDLFVDSPPEGWPQWMENEIAASDYVLVVCSESYLKKIKENQAKGVVWEANIVYQMQYDEKCKTSKFIPVFWNKGEDQFIPIPIKGYTHYNIGTEDGYKDLWRRLLGIPKYPKAELGKIEPDKYSYTVLPKKQQRTMFCSTSIDVDLWNKAKWKALAFLFSPNSEDYPILGFAFENIKAGVEIFKKWKWLYSKDIINDYIKISFIIPPFPKNCYVYSDPEKNKGNGYFVHVGVDIEKAAQRAKDANKGNHEHYIMSISRFIWVDNNEANNREKFTQLVGKQKGFYIMPVKIQGTKVEYPEEQLFDLMLELQQLDIKRGDRISETDHCKAVLEPPIH